MNIQAHTDEGEAVTIVGFLGEYWDDGNMAVCILGTGRIKTIQCSELTIEQAYRPTGADNRGK